MYSLIDPTISAGVTKAITNNYTLIAQFEFRDMEYSIDTAWKIFITQRRVAGSPVFIVCKETLLIHRTPFKIANKVGRQ